MKITFLVRTLDCGGAQRQLVLLSRGLHERGHDVRIIVFYANGQFEAELRDAGIRVECLRRTGRWDLLSIWNQSASLIAGDPPDIIHGYLETPNILALLLRRKAPQARVVFGIRASQIDYRKYDRAIQFMNWVEVKASRKADLVISNSTAGADHAIAAGFPANKLKVIFNGIDVLKFRRDEEGRRTIRQEWGVTPGQKLIGLVGRVDPKKDHATFLKAASRLRRTRPGTRFVCVGDGPESELRALRQLACDLGLDESLRWAGRRNDMAAVYSALDVLCSSSAFGEGFGNVIGEAMACDVPCVVTDCGDSAFIVGDTGVIVPTSNAEQLSAGVQEILKRDLSVMGANARQRILVNFSEERLLRETEAAMLDLRIPAVDPILSRQTGETTECH